MDFIERLIRHSGYSPQEAPASQASLAERQFLQSWVRDQYRGVGDIVELGVGGGGTAYPICNGLAQNSRPINKTKRVHLFDWYELGEKKFANKIFFREDHSETDGNSFLPDVCKNLAAFGDSFRVISGDIVTVETGFGADTAIEILHIDIAKVIETHKAVFARFFEHLIPGISLILHQDFASPRLPWIHYSTGALLPYITILSDPIRSTLPFRLDHPIPAPLLQKISEDDFTTEEKIHLIQSLKPLIEWDRTRSLPYYAVLDMACAYVYRYAGDLPQSRKWLAEVQDVPYMRNARKSHLTELRKPL